VPDSRFLEIINSRRSIRQFKQTDLERNKIKTCINCARLAPSAANVQPLEYFYIDEPGKVAQIFPLLKWAGYIAPQGNPQKGRQPRAYLILMVNQKVKQTEHRYDAGAAVENFILAAWSYGIGSCWLLSVDRQRLRKLLDIPDKYTIDSVVALGYPDEKPVTEPYQGSIEYWQDETGQLHVPKRQLDDILHINTLNTDKSP